MSTWVVVGSNRGIGLELVRQLVARGDTVIATCRTRSPELDLVCKGAVGAEVVDGIDVTSDAAVGTLVRAIAARPIDTLVVMAGVLKRVALDDLRFDIIREQLEVNALAPLRVTAALIPSLVKGSKIALVTSRMGSIADNTSGGHYAYRMSKAALNMAGKSLAVDLKGRGIALCLLHPGFVRTDMTGGHGDIDAAGAAARLLQRIDELRLETTGKLLHGDGTELPW